MEYHSETTDYGFNGIIHYGPSGHETNYLPGSPGGTGKKASSNDPGQKELVKWLTTTLQPLIDKQHERITKMFPNILKRCTSNLYVMKPKQFMNQEQSLLYLCLSIS
jgi:hypothetical protein